MGTTIGIEAGQVWEGRTMRRDGTRERLATRWRWPAVPPLGLVTFVDPAQVRSTRTGKGGRSRGPGYCYLRAGFTADGATQGGLLAFRMRPEGMPEPAAPMGDAGQMLLGGAQ